MWVGVYHILEYSYNAFIICNELSQTNSNNKQKIATVVVIIMWGFSSCKRNTFIIVSLISHQINLTRLNGRRKPVILFISKAG